MKEIKKNKSRQTCSVIIPTYNAEGCIIRCLNSLREQCYDGLEIIIVDDGSTDATKKIVSKIAEEDCRIKMITQDHGGPNKAQNGSLTFMMIPCIMYYWGISLTKVI